MKKAEAVTGSDGVIRIPYVDTPELIHFPADPKKATGTCIIVCPGGGYGKLAWNKEGTEIATWLNTLGVEAVALKYRVPILILMDSSKSWKAIKWVVCAPLSGSGATLFS